jgi:hypothetical protein
MSLSHRDTREVRHEAMSGVWEVVRLVSLPAVCARGAPPAEGRSGVSAFVVSKQHIDALVTAAVSAGGSGHRLRWFSRRIDRERDTWESVREISCEMTWDRVNDVGQMLVDECVKSVAYRYPNSDDLPGPADFEYWRFPYLYARPLQPLSIVAAVKAIHCYEYQSCEHPGWDTSEAHQFCRALEGALVRQLPGYDEASWEVTERVSR